MPMTPHSSGASQRAESILAALVLVVTACAASPAALQPSADAGPGAAPAQLTVLAASSLTAAFSEMGKAFEAAHAGSKVVFSFSGSQALRSQLEQGARADVFASADARNMEQAAAGGLVQGQAVVFTRNRLVVIAPRDSLVAITEPKDLARPGLKLVIADAGVPAGDYALQVITRLAADPAYGADFKTQALARIVSRENNVKQVVSKVVLGEADAGIVYATDAQAESARLAVIAIPDQYNVVAAYPIAVMKGSSNAALAQAFIDFAMSDGGQAIMAKYGFGAR